MADSTKAVFLPDYASYNWTGAPANFLELATNTDTGGDSRKFLDDALKLWSSLTNSGLQVLRMSTNGTNPVTRPTLL